MPAGAHGSIRPRGRGDDSASPLRIDWSEGADALPVGVEGAFSPARDAVLRLLRHPAYSNEPRAIAGTDEDARGGGGGEGAARGHADKLLVVVRGLSGRSVIYVEDVYRYISCEMLLTI